MTKAYPSSLRWRVVMLKVSGQTQEDIATILSVSRTFVKYILKLYNNTGDVVSLPRKKGKVRKLTGPEYLLIRRMIRSNPELYLDEMQSWLEYLTGEVYAVQTIDRQLKQMGLTVKKMQVIARQRNEYRRAEFRRFVSQFQQHQFIFIDESSKDERTTQRKFGHSLANTRVSTIGNFTRGTRYSVLGAVCSTGVKAAHAINGSFNRLDFEFAMEHFVIPHIRSCALAEECSVVILDNCSIHMSPAVFERIRSKGGIVVFLPPYSPDLNPIETCFSIAKRWLLQHKDVCEIYYIT